MLPTDDSFAQDAIVSHEKYAWLFDHLKNSPPSQPEELARAHKAEQAKGAGLGVGALVPSPRAAAAGQGQKYDAHMANRLGEGINKRVTLSDKVRCHYR